MLTGTDDEAAWPGSDGGDVSRRRRPAGLQQVMQLPLPRRDPGRIKHYRRRRWTALGDSAVSVADGPTGVA